jgi:hypothetical protein
MTDPTPALSDAAVVRRSGLAAVEEGEVIFAALGSTAQAEQLVDDARANIEFHFPVHVEVLRAAESEIAHEAADHALRRLADHLRGV